MKRERLVASTPARSPMEAWQAIAGLVRSTVTASPHITSAAVEHALEQARPAALALVAGGHTDKNPLTVVSGKVFCEIRTVSGDRALDLEENLNGVPGAAEADSFVLHLPPVEPHGDLVRKTCRSSRHLSTEPPDQAATETASRHSAEPVIDLSTLERARDRR